MVCSCRPRIAGVLLTLWTVSFVASIHAETALREVPPGHRKMLDLLKQIADRTPEEHIYIGDSVARRLRERLAATSADTPALERWQLYMAAGEAELRLGNEAEAIDLFTRARQLLPPPSNPTLGGIEGGRPAPAVVNQTLFRLGVAYLRLGETQNCCVRHTPDSCILPLRGGGLHIQQDAARQAIACFTQVLQNPSENSALEARWLLNIAYMTIGGYPEQVPEPYLIPPKAFESEEQIPHFTNIAPRLGLDTFDLAGGAIADDFNNDGYLDIVVSTSDTAGQIRFFRNNQDGTFSEQTERAGLLGLYGGLNLVQADYDNDGDIDILVLRGAWLNQNGRHPNSLLRNNGDGTFTDVTFDAGLGLVHYPTQTASWGDYDNDGDIDLYIGNESSETLNAPCQLFRNNGDGSFTDVAAVAGVQNNGFTKAVIWGDYDGDRWQDIYVSNYKGPNRLYRNNSDGTFTDMAWQLDVAFPMESFPAWFWDFDNDGWRNGAIELDGAGGYMKVSDKFKLTTNTVTVVAWINGWKTIDWSGIVVGRSGTPFWMGVASNDTLTYVWNNDAGNTWGWQGAPKIPKEKWALVSIAIEPKKAMSYIYDGAVGKLDAATNEIPHLEQTITNLKFGWDECCGARYFKGKIDEVMIFNRTLTQAEIQQLAKQGLAVDSAGKLAVTWATIKQQ